MSARISFDDFDNCRTLTEDAELYAACLCRGARIGYCETAVTYDEEPVTWRASLVQRRRWMSGILQVARLTLPELLTNFLRQPSLNCLDGLLQLSFPFLQALTPFFALEALLAGSMSLQGLPVSLLTAYAGCLAAAVAALALERRLDRKLVGDAPLPCFHGLLPAAADAGSVQNADHLA